MIYTFSALHNKLIHEKEIPEKLGKIMMRSVWGRIDEVKESQFIPFLLIMGKPNEEEKRMTLGWFFPEDEEAEVSVRYRMDYCPDGKEEK